MSPGRLPTASIDPLHISPTSGAFDLSDSKRTPRVLPNSSVPPRHDSYFMI